MIEVEAVLVEPVLCGRVVPGAEQILQHEDLVGATLNVFLFVAVPERRLRSLVDVGQNRPAATASVTIGATSGLVRRVPNVSADWMVQMLSLRT